MSSGAEDGSEPYGLFSAFTLIDDAEARIWKIGRLQRALTGLTENLALVQKALRHADVSSTIRYGHMMAFELRRNL
ncbi:hypothetical protein [Roseibium sp.]|uniref:hypothetical protein n=1 Tax=Roseibium sp. TaxID=1936156 RepID=UPI003B51851D